MHVGYQIWSPWVSVEELCYVFSIVVPRDQTSTIVVEVPDLEFLVFGRMDQLTTRVVPEEERKFGC